MNLRLAKALRSLAGFITKGERPLTNYQVEEHRMLRGTPAEYLSIQLRVAPTCFRGVYRNLKKQARRNRLTYAQLTAKQRGLSEIRATHMTNAIDSVSLQLPGPILSRNI